ncbi:MAG: hypothetical protein JXQ75_12965 [Phycisphaerae bacterium]|nr:hypothetical protein [Phycisphaerae bacterium]
MMRTQNTAGVFALAMLWAGTSAAMAQHELGERGEQSQHAKQELEGVQLPLCPVTGEPIDFNVKTMTDEGPVYFCCEGCIKEYEKDPAKYAKKTETQRAALKKMERVQVTCPVTGNPIDGKTFAMIDGRGVSFCCEDCVGKYQQDPAKYRAKLEASYTYQVRCPVMGGKIDPKSYTDLPTGERVYLCCPGCESKLLTDPEKYAPSLAKQGVNIDVKKLKEALAKKDKGDQTSGGHDPAGHDHP